MQSILLIDDKKAQLAELKSAVAKELRDEHVIIKTWAPTGKERDPKAKFDELTREKPTLVVTDYDLTAGGHTGLFGSTIVAWCQQRSIPVADYSRAHPDLLPRDPDLFEIRVPHDIEPATFIAGIFTGFQAISDALANNDDLLKARSAAAVIAAMLSAPEAENEFALYAVRLGPASGALMTRVTDTAPDDIRPTADEKRSVLAFIAGHILLNAVLRFPGPIMSLAALKAYLATDAAGDSDIQDLMAEARYTGPFSCLDQFYWLSHVDEVLEGILPSDVQTETAGELRRIAVESMVKRELSRHSCKRCDGQNGGFYCPFTKRTVCLRADCSVGSNSWIPQGARLCRIERDFFDEWAPVLGL
jgi:hypothetical protein